MKNVVSFDWFSFTLKSRSLEDSVNDFGLNMSDFNDKCNGKYGYKYMITHSSFHISVMYGGSDEMGIHYAISGSAIRFFFECYASNIGQLLSNPFDQKMIYDSDYVFKEFTRYVLKYGQFSRVDVNIDTDNEFIAPSNLFKLFDAGHKISYYRSYSYINNPSGDTFYIGKRSSNSCIRVYDKAKEQGDFDSVLYRFEVQLNSNTADEFMVNFLNGDLASTFSLFVQKQIRFVENGNYKKSSFDGWVDFVKLLNTAPGASYIRYEARRKNNTIESLLHMFTQYNAKIGDFFDTFGNIDDFIEFLFVVSRSLSDGSDVYDYLDSKGWGNVIDFDCMWYCALVG